MEFVDKALARRLESAEEVPQVKYAKLYQTLYPEIGAAAEPICGGHMIFAGLNSPMGRAVGMGFNETPVDNDLNRMEDFYWKRDAPAKIDVCPLTDPALLEMLKTRHYFMEELNNVLFRRLDKNVSCEAPEGFIIRTARPQESDKLAEILVKSFFPDGNAPENFGAMISPMYKFDGVLPFVAEKDGELVACGCGLRIPEHGIVAMFGAATKPEFRSHGLQTTLFRFRMKAAADAGCEYAVVVTQGGTTSQRNAERLGFRVAYSKATLVRSFAADGTRT